MNNTLQLVYYSMSQLMNYPNKQFDQDILNFLIALLNEIDFYQEASILKEFFGQPSPQEKLAIEYTRLFIQDGKNPAPAPPYASFYLENRLWGQSTEEIAILYHTHNFQIPANEIPDAVYWELSFLAHISATGDRHGEDVMLQHMCKWFPLFQQRVESHAAYPFYSILVRLIRLLITKEDFQDV